MYISDNYVSTIIIVIIILHQDIFVISSIYIYIMKSYWEDEVPFHYATRPYCPSLLAGPLNWIQYPHRGDIFKS